MIVANLFALLRELSDEAAHNATLLFQFSSEKVAIIGNAQNVNQSATWSDGKKRDKPSRNAVEKMENPFRLLRSMSLSHCIMLSSAMLAMFGDYFDFYALTIQTVKLAAYYNTSKSEISDAITYTMLTRGIGALVFGIVADLYGRKWPLVANLVFLGVLQIATIYCETTAGFLGTRALFGVGMGGIWGCSAAAVMEFCPFETKGLLSGVFQGTISVSFIVASAVNWAVGEEPESWKNVFWIGAGLSFGGALVRAVTPESPQFIVLNADATPIGEKALTANEKARSFLRRLGKMFRKEWKMIVYCIIFVAHGSFLGHAITDTYTTFLIVAKGFDNAKASQGSMIMKSGGVVGAVLGGYFSEYVGRRRLTIIFCFGVCAFIPAAILPTSLAPLAAGGFFLMLCVQGVGGVLPIHLNELSSPAFRAVLPGVAYQFGNVISAPSAQIVNTLAEKLLVTVHIANHPPKAVQSYGPIIAIMAGTVAISMANWVTIGPERRGARFEEFVPAAVADSASTSNTTTARNSIEGANHSVVIFIDDDEPSKATHSKEDPFQHNGKP